LYFVIKAFIDEIDLLTSKIGGFKAGVPKNNIGSKNIEGGQDRVDKHHDQVNVW